MKRSSPTPLLASAILALSLSFFALELGAQPGASPKLCPRHHKVLASPQPADSLQCLRGADAVDCPRGMDCPRPEDCPRRDDVRVGSARHAEFFAHALGLDPNQRALVGAIDSGWFLETEPQRQQILEKHESLRALLGRSADSQGDADRLIDEIAGLHAQVQKKRYAADLRIRALLTPEQQATFDSIPQRHQGHPDWSHRGMRGRAPRHGSAPAAGK